MIEAANGGGLSRNKPMYSTANTPIIRARIHQVLVIAVISGVLSDRPHVSFRQLRTFRRISKLHVHVA
jgi:hypothetical protein